MMQRPHLRKGHEQRYHKNLDWSLLPLLQQVDMVDLLRLLVRGVDLKDHRAHVPQDGVRAVPLSKQLAVGR